MTHIYDTWDTCEKWQLLLRQFGRWGSQVHNAEAGNAENILAELKFIISISILIDFIFLFHFQIILSFISFLCTYVCVVARPLRQCRDLGMQRSSVYDRAAKPEFFQQRKCSRVHSCCSVGEQIDVKIFWSNALMYLSTHVMIFPLLGVYTAGAPLNNLSTVIDHECNKEKVKSTLLSRKKKKIWMI